jgi:hypothetical protein
MDILCPKCGEPWDIYELGEQAREVAEWEGAHYEDVYKALRREFSRKGCEAFEGGRCSEPLDKGRSALISEVYGLLGDDMDGAAAMLEDAELLGLL